MRAQSLVCAILLAVAIRAAPTPTIWQRNFPDGGTIIPTRDGGGLVLSQLRIDEESTDTDLRLVRIDSRGETLWFKDYGGASIESAQDGAELPDGSFIIAGESFSPISRNKTSPLRGVSDFWFLRVTANGDLMWERSWGGTGRDMVKRLHVFGDTIFAVGDTESPISGNKTSPQRGAFDVCLVKLTTAGEILWDKTYGSNNGQFFVESLATNETRLHLVMGALNPPSVPDPIPDLRYFAWVVAIDGSDGRELWNNSYSTLGRELPSGATFLNDGNIAMAGACLPDLTLQTTFITKLNPDTGALIWRNELRRDDRFTAIAPGIRPGAATLVTNYKIRRDSEYDDLVYSIAEYDGSNADEPVYHISSPRFGGEAQSFVSPLRHIPGRGYLFVTTVQRRFSENTYGEGGDVYFWYLNDQLEEVGSLYLGGSAPEILAELRFTSTGEIFVMANSKSDRSFTKTTPLPDKFWIPHNWFFKMPGWFEPRPRLTELFIEPSAFRDQFTAATPLVLSASQDGALALQYSDDLRTWQTLQTINFSSDPAHATDPTRSEKRFYRLAPP